MISERLGDSAPQERSSVQASGRIERDPSGSGYRLELRTGAGERQLSAADCRELASSASLILALLIDPHAAPEAAELPAASEPAVVSPPSAAPEPEPEPRAGEPGEPTTPRSWRFTVRPELVADLGILPAVAAGPGLALGLRFGATSLELSGSYLPTQQVERPNGTGSVAELRAIGLQLGACQALLARPRLGPCLQLEYASLSGRGINVSDGESASAPVLTALLGLRLSVAFRDWLHGVLELAAGLPVRGAEATVGNIGVVHETGDLVGRLRTGVEFQL